MAKHSNFWDSHLIVLVLFICTVQSTSQQCGWPSGSVCAPGSCCAGNGTCGTGDAFCGQGCQIEYGSCQGVVSWLRMMSVRYGTAQDIKILSTKVHSDSRIWVMGVATITVDDPLSQSAELVFAGSSEMSILFPVSSRSVWVAVFDALGDPKAGHLLYHYDGVLDLPEPVGLELATINTYKYGGVLVPCCTGETVLWVDSTSGSFSNVTTSESGWLLVLLSDNSFGFTIQDTFQTTSNVVPSFFRAPSTTKPIFFFVGTTNATRAVMRTQTFNINRASIPGGGAQDVIVSWIDYSKPITASVTSTQSGAILSWIPSTPSWSGGQRITPVSMSFDSGDRPYILLSSTASAIAEDTSSTPNFFSKVHPAQSTSELVVLRLDYPWNQPIIYSSIRRVQIANSSYDLTGAAIEVPYSSSGNMNIAWRATSRVAGPLTLLNGYSFASIQRINNTQNGVAVYMQPNYFVPSWQGIRSIASFRLSGSRLSMLADFRGNVTGAPDDPFAGHVTSKGELDSLLWVVNNTLPRNTFRPTFTRGLGGFEATMSVTGSDFMSPTSAEMVIAGSWRRYWWVLLQNAPNTYYALTSNNADKWRPFILLLDTQQLSNSVTAGAPVFGQPPIPTGAQQPLAPPTPESPPVDPPSDPPANPPADPPVDPPMDLPPVDPPSDPPVDPPSDIPPQPVASPPPVRPPVRAPVAPPVRPPVRPPVLAPQRPPVDPPARPPQRPPALAPQRPPVNPPQAPPIAPPAPPPIAPPAGPPIRIIVRPPVLYTPAAPALPPEEPGAPIFDSGPGPLPPPPPPPPRNAPPRIPPTPAILGPPPIVSAPEATPTTPAFLSFFGRDWTQMEFYLLIGCSAGGFVLLLIILCCCCKSKKKKTGDEPVVEGEAYEVNVEEIQRMPETPVASITPAKLEKRFSRRFSQKKNARVHSQQVAKDWWQNSPNESPLFSVEMTQNATKNHDPSPASTELEDSSSAEERRRRRRARYQSDDI